MFVYCIYLKNVSIFSTPLLDLVFSCTAFISFVLHLFSHCKQMRIRRMGWNTLQAVWPIFRRTVCLGKGSTMVVVDINVCGFFKGTRVVPGNRPLFSQSNFLFVPQKWIAINLHSNTKQRFTFRDKYLKTSRIRQNSHWYDKLFFFCHLTEPAILSSKFKCLRENYAINLYSLLKVWHDREAGNSHSGSNSFEQKPTVCCHGNIPTKVCYTVGYDTHNPHIGLKEGNVRK